jgi:diaminopimelate decarboxylase
MHHFRYRDNQMFCEDVPILKIAKDVGTPFYVYSHATLTRHFRAFDSAFNDVPHLVCFSAKANANLAVLKLFANLGSGLDIVSGGELYRGLMAGIPPEKIVYSGVGKRKDEIEYALQSNILMFNIESFQELEAVNRCAERLNTKARIGLRVNPDVDPKTHPYISTGMKRNKFGIDNEAAIATYKAANALSHVDVVGIDCHIGSQLTDTAPFVDALRKLKELITNLEHLGIRIQYLDLGGGLGITYDQETPPHPDDYAKAIVRELENAPFTLIFEPGRVIVGNAGVLITECLYVKKSEQKNFVVVDAAMNDLARPSLYDAYHAIKPVTHVKRSSFVADVVGPICESGDFFARDRKLPAFEPGDLLALMSAGAYGFTMSSNYNSRPRVPEVMVKGDQFRVVRERETYKNLIQGESIPTFFK